MKGVVAEPVRTRVDKMGFPVPAARWVAGPWFEPLRDTLGRTALRESGICHVDRVLRDLDEHRAGRIDVAGRLFQLAQFSLWLDRSSMPVRHVSLSAQDLAARSA
jgi:asparagine synthase (glutamine-hydrolysing)